MDIKALRYFAELVRQQNFTRAAEALFVTQPTISKMVRSLEEEIGEPLLQRQGHSFSLTAAGELLLGRARSRVLQFPEAKRLYTDGNARPGVEIKLTEDGEILSRGPDLCLGYTDPVLTAKAFDDDGWYHTGDIGVLDADGYLTITDRTTDLIIRGGENISALEVEEVLLTMPEVTEAVVVAADRKSVV